VVEIFYDCEVFETVRSRCKVPAVILVVCQTENWVRFINVLIL